MILDYLLEATFVFLNNSKVMIFSYSWLKEYVPDLPSLADLEKAIIFHAFEVEQVEARGEDYILDIKVLPDRAHDCLSHLGVAREIGAILNLPLLIKEGKTDFALGKAQDLTVNLVAKPACRRYVGLRVSGVNIGESPAWLKSRLEVIDQRSINNIVDATNYVMFALGQPMHAFDADKVVGDITVRFAQAGERFTTLDGRDLTLDESILVIADDEGPLALAGIKGGNRAEVDAKTKNLILESANFDPVLIRRTSAKLNLRTDASKRFENNLSPEMALPAMLKLADVLQDLAGGDYAGIVDVYPEPETRRTISLNFSRVNERLGVIVSPVEIKDILLRLGFVVDKETGEGLELNIPFWRVDLEEDINLIEEIGRIYGYEKIKPKLIGIEDGPLKTPQGPSLMTISFAEKSFAVKNKLREILVKAGFVEVMGYALTDRGEVELANPLASDKAWLRSNLTDWLKEKINFNLNNVLFDTEAVKIFEIGKVFKAGFVEQTNIAIGIGYRKKVKGVDINKEFEDIKGKISRALKLPESSSLGVAQGLPSGSGTSETLLAQEFNLDELIEEVGEVGPTDLSSFNSLAFNYQPISPYPRIVRDVAVWVSEDTKTEEVADLIKSSLNELCVLGPVLFDEFSKEGRRSLAFRLVFQSYDRTLSDDEANLELNKVIESLESKSYEVRK